ncbi:MAG TPA: M20/M25/M40 family metallo-hydrolase [Gemmatimonadales bacterium]|nr:M20/M25/M40 family metallo-hydrolase [Gemmatimonadales bacterium]
MRSLLPALCAITLGAPPTLGAQSPPATRLASAIRPEALQAHLTFLADDALEGRAPATRGGDLAARYIAAQFARLGLEPAGDDGTWFHRIPVVTHTPQPELEITAPERRALRYRDDYVLWSMRDEPEVEVLAPVVFVGYGIDARDSKWNDFAGADVKGKIIVALVNDPGLRDETLFRGRELTYFGRWTYKLEEAERQGAAGILLVHTTESATYPWSTVMGSWSKTQVRLARTPGPLLAAGWLTEEAAGRLLAAGGQDLAGLSAAAARPGFRAVPLGVTMRALVRSTLTRSETANVVARLPGKGPHADEAVLVGGHYDHLGIGQPVNGDSIYNGAQDNASGTAAVLALAEAFVASGVRPARSVLFMAFGAEESGLIGSEAFARRPTLPLRRLVAVMNVDVVNLHGRTRDIGALGSEHSSLGTVFAQAARAEGLRVVDDPRARITGSFFRSDHFPFAKAGVPALSLSSGLDFVGRPADWGKAQRAAYDADRYHRPQDEWLPAYSVDGAVQQMRVVARVVLAVASAANQPIWASTSEFADAGRARSAP